MFPKQKGEDSEPCCSRALLLTDTRNHVSYKFCNAAIIDEFLKISKQISYALYPLNDTFQSLFCWIFSANTALTFVYWHHLPILFLTTINDPHSRAFASEGICLAASCLAKDMGRTTWKTLLQYLFYCCVLVFRSLPRNCSTCHNNYTIWIQIFKIKQGKSFRILHFYATGQRSDFYKFNRN